MTNSSKGEKSLIDTLNILGIKDVVPEAYRDLLQPAAQELGKSLVIVARAVSIALAPVEGAVWGYDRIRNWLSAKLTQKLAQADDTAIQPPPMNIAGPVIMNLTFSGEIPPLREMYANLLASSMNSSTAQIAHPAFVSIIEQLAPDEAKILETLAHHPSGQALCHTVTNDTGIPKRSEKSIDEQWVQMCSNAKIEHSDNMFAYMDNLLRLRLIAEVSESKSKLIPEGGNDYGDWASHIDGTIEQTLYLTDFGERFISTCVA